MGLISITTAQKRGSSTRCVSPSPSPSIRVCIFEMMARYPLLFMQHAGHVVTMLDKSVADGYLCCKLRQLHVLPRLAVLHVVPHAPYFLLMQFAASPSPFCLDGNFALSGQRCWRASVILKASLSFLVRQASSGMREVQVHCRRALPQSLAASKPSGGPHSPSWRMHVATDLPCAHLKARWASSSWTSRAMPGRVGARVGLRCEYCCSMCVDQFEGSSGGSF